VSVILHHFLGTVVFIVSALFPIVNPLGSAPIFLLHTRELTQSQRHTLALYVGWYSLLLMMGSMLAGSYVLRFFGVSLPIVQVGGGLLVFASGWKLLLADDNAGAHSAPGCAPGELPKHKAFYPLTLPLTVGPGSIATAITLGADQPPMGGGRLLLSLVAAITGTLIVAITVVLCYAFSDRLAKAIGPTGIGIVLRLSAFLLLCIGLQIVWNGLSALFHLA
jgi:multiple antibiotic resistance protein